MKDKSSAATIAGIVLGVLFLGAALIPYSRWYPLMVPLLGGALATFLASRTSSVTSGEGIKLGAQAGAIGAVILLVFGAPLTYFVIRHVMQAQLSQAEVQRDFLTILLSMIIPAGMVLVLSVIGGIVAVPMFGKRAH